MSHLIILILVLNLITGTAVYLYVLSAARKFRQPFMKTLLAYIVSFNGLVIVYFIYTYVMTNVFGSNPREIFLHPLLSSVLLFVVYCAEFGFTVSFFRLVRQLQNRKMTAWTKGFFVLWGSVFFVGSAYSLLLFFKDMRWQLFYWIHAAWLFSLVVIILTVLITALVSAGEKGADQNSLRSFARLFLAGYAAFALLNLDYYFFHTGFQKYYDPILLLLINLCPFLWLKFFFEKQFRYTEAEDIENKLSNFCAKFGISTREQDIIVQVMQGKTNKDIEKVLFISHNTVKNHLYSVYQKAGVKSRSELIHHISQMNN